MGNLECNKVQARLADPGIAAAALHYPSQPGCLPGWVGSVCRGSKMQVEVTTDAADGRK